MNMREAKKLQPGAIVRESWGDRAINTGLVLSKEYVVEDHIARCLSQRKGERYDVYVHWLGGPRNHGRGMNNPEKLQSWEIMVLEHA